MSNKPGYKPTEIGEIPEEWEIVKLNEIATDFIGGGTPSTSRPEYWDGGIPWMRSAWIRRQVVDSGERYITEEGLKNSATNIVPKGNILVATRVCIGNVAINKIDIAISQDLTGVVIDKQKACPEYIYWALRSSERKIKSLVQGSTIKGVLREDLKVLKLALPPVVEQEKIAEILSSVDEAIQRIDEIIQKTQELKRGLMQQLLTKGIGHTKFKQTEIGEIPEEWEVEKLGDCLSICQYGLSIPLSDEGKYPILRMNNFQNGYVVPSDIKFVNIDEGLLSQFKLERGDILFNRTNSYDLVGKIGIFLLKGNYTFASYLIRLRTNSEKADPHFINYYLNTPFAQNKLKSMATRGVSQSNINAKNLKSLAVPLPPLHEQQRISSILSAVDEKTKKERQRKEQLDKLKKGLIQDLLTGKVRVKVN